MKKIFYLIVSLLIVAVSCNKEQPPTLNGNNFEERVLNIEAQMPIDNRGPSTKISLYESAEGNIQMHWKVGDVLSFAFVDNGGEVIGVETTTVTEVLEEGLKARFSLSIPTDIEGTFDLYGVYGAPFESSSSKNIVIGSALGSGNGTLESAEEYAVIVCSAKDLTVGNSISLSFEHVGSIVGVWLTNSSASSIEVGDVEIYSDNSYSWVTNPDGGDKIDITTGAFSESTTGASMVIRSEDIENGKVTIESGKTAKVYRWILPSISFQAEERLNVKIDGIDITETLPSINFIPSKYYRLKLEYTGAEWRRFEEPTQFYFTIPDFEESEVYKVVYNGKQVGEVAREYLRMGTAIHDKAIVAYPTTDDGTTLSTHLNRGFVAEILYSVNNTGALIVIDNRHGGRVSFDLATNSILESPAGYVRGALSSPVTTVYIDEDGVVGNTPIAGSVEATTEPYLITDIRGGESNIYPIVKIGTQYWMGKNLNTTKYNSNLGFAYIPTNITNTEWGAINSSGNYTPAICVHDFPDANSAEAVATRDKLGVLYSYLAISGKASISTATFDEDGNMEDHLSPEGWIVPTRAELTALLNYITYTKRLRLFLDENGLPMNISGKKDENITGFGARNGSYRNYSGPFVALGSPNGAFFWTRSMSVGDGATADRGWSLNLVGMYEQAYMRAFSIRCIKK